jgi:hypothetical protein
MIISASTVTLYLQVPFKCILEKLTNIVFSHDSKFI